MSNDTNTRLIENAYERFVWFYRNDKDFRYDIRTFCFTEGEILMCDTDDFNERAINRIFDWMLLQDFESACKDIVSFVYNYYKINEQKERIWNE